MEQAGIPPSREPLRHYISIGLFFQGSARLEGSISKG
jgi:hypothetical protein